MKPEPIRTKRLIGNFDQVRVVAEHNHLTMLGGSRKHPEERSGSRVISGDEKIVADDRQCPNSGSPLDRTETKR